MNNEFIYEWNMPLISSRLLQNIPHGPKPQQLVFGLMLGQERKQTRLMAQHTFWSILPLRYAAITSIRVGVITDRIQGTQSRTQQQLELEIENMGGHLNAYTSVGWKL